MLDSPQPWMVRADGPIGKLKQRFNDERTMRAFVQREITRRQQDGGTVTILRYDAEEDMYVIDTSHNIQKGS